MKYSMACEAAGMEVKHMPFKPRQCKNLPEKLPAECSEKLLCPKRLDSSLHNET